MTADTTKRFKPKREMCMITAGNKIYSEDSVRRYVKRLIAEVKPLMDPFKRDRTEKRILKSIDLFNKTDVMTDVEVCRIVMYKQFKERKGK